MLKISNVIFAAVLLSPLAAAQAQEFPPPPPPPWEGITTPGSSAMHAAQLTVVAEHIDGCQHFTRSVYVMEQRHNVPGGPPNIAVVTFNQSEHDACTNRNRQYQGYVVVGPEGLGPIEDVAMVTDAFTRLTATNVKVVIPMTKFDCTNIPAPHCPESFDLPIDLTIFGGGEIVASPGPVAYADGSNTIIAVASSGTRFFSGVQPTATHAGRIGNGPMVPPKYEIVHESGYMWGAVEQQISIPQGHDLICAE